MDLIEEEQDLLSSSAAACKLWFGLTWAIASESTAVLRACDSAGTKSADTDTAAAAG